MKFPASIKNWAENPVVTPGMVRAAAVTVAAAALVVPLALVAVPYIEFFNDMAVQYKVKAQMVWKVVAGRAVGAEFPPAEGAVPGGVHEYPFPVPRMPDPESQKKIEAQIAAQAAVALDAQGPDIAPTFWRPKPTMTAVQRGQKLFNTYCIVCHGKYGFGDGMVPQKGFPAPPSLLDRKERDFSDGRIFHIITVGQNAVMPGYAYALTPEDRWAVVLYVRALQAAFPPPPPVPSPPEVPR